MYQPLKIINIKMIFEGIISLSPHKRSLYCFFNPVSAGTVFPRQNLTSSARGLSLYVVCRRSPQTNKIGIQMNRKELTKTFIMISN